MHYSLKKHFSARASDSCYGDAETPKRESKIVSKTTPKTTFQGNPRRQQDVSETWIYGKLLFALEAPRREWCFRAWDLGNGTLVIYRYILESSGALRAPSILLCAVIQAARARMSQRLHPSIDTFHQMQGNF